MISFIEAVIHLFHTTNQILLDIAVMLLGNVTLTINSTIAWIFILAGVLYDAEALLEKGITLLTG